jgi:hypothetical protein
MCKNVRQKLKGKDNYLEELQDGIKVDRKGMGMEDVD